MASDNLFIEFIDKLKKDKTDEEVGEFLANLMKFGATELYLTMITQLKEEDFEALDKITEEEKALQEVKDRFKLRTGYTPEEFVVKLRDKIAQGYLFPDLAPKTA